MQGAARFRAVTGSNSPRIHSAAFLISFRTPGGFDYPWSPARGGKPEFGVPGASPQVRENGIIGPCMRAQTKLWALDPSHERGGIAISRIGPIERVRPPTQPHSRAVE